MIVKKWLVSLGMLAWVWGVAETQLGSFGQRMIASGQQLRQVQPVGAQDRVGEPPFRITEIKSRWMQFQEPLGKTWSFENFRDREMDIDGSLKIGIENSPLDLYLADVPRAFRLYLWEDGRLVPDMPHTHIKPTLAVWGDMLVGDIFAIEDNPMTMFMRQEKNLSASATTSFFAARLGTGTDIDGGAAIVLHPDHHRDLEAWPEDPTDHSLSGSLELIAYGQGVGKQSNAIVFKTRSGPGKLAERMIIKDHEVHVDGNVVATGTVTAGSSRAYKQNMEPLSAVEAARLVTGLEAIHFHYKAQPDQPRLGFVAEEVPEIFSAAGRRGVDPMGIVAALLRLVQTNRARMDQLSAQVRAVSEANRAGLLALAAASEPPVVAASQVDLAERVPPLIREVNGQWFQLETAQGKRWHFDHVHLPRMNIDSALRISLDRSLLDFYLADEADGLHMYLWRDGMPVPNMPRTGKRPAMSLRGDMFVGNIATIGRQPRDMFLREETGLSAASGTVLFCAGEGINHLKNGGAGIVIRPDHHQDLEVWPDDPVDHYQSGSLQLIAFGEGAGSRANSVIFQTRDGLNSTADRMMVNENVTIYGNLTATGSITPGSSREFKKNVRPLSGAEAASLVADLRAVSFSYKADPHQRRLGFIAEEVPAVFGTAGRNGVDAMGVATALAQAVKTQQLEIDNLRFQIHGLADANPSARGAGGENIGATAERPNQSSQGSPTVEKTAIATSTNVSLPKIPPFQISGSGPWLELEETKGKTWSLGYFRDLAMGIPSALQLQLEDSARDFYLADEPGGMRMYLWEDGTTVPDLPQTGAKPHLAIGGDFFLGDIITNGRAALRMFSRVEGKLSASATTTLYAARDGITSDVDGGAGIIMHPDHHHDPTSYPGDPVEHLQSGSLELVAYGQGEGAQANAILVQSRAGDALADRMVIKDGTVTVVGNISATGSVIVGSSRATKNNIQALSAREAFALMAGLEPMKFSYKAQPDQPRLGFIAEEVTNVFGTPRRKAVDPMGITAALTRVVQAQHEQLNHLFHQVGALRNLQGAAAQGATGELPSTGTQPRRTGQSVAPESTARDNG